MVELPSLLGWLLGLRRIALSLIFAIEEIGLEGSQVELPRRLVNQEANLGLGVILKLGIDPFDGFFQSLLHYPRLWRLEGWQAGTQKLPDDLSILAS